MEETLIIIFTIGLGVAIILLRKRMAEASVSFNNKYLSIKYGEREAKMFTWGNLVVGAGLIALAIYNIARGLGWV